MLLALLVTKKVNLNKTISPADKLNLGHSSINFKYAPLLEKAFRKPHKRPEAIMGGLFIQMNVRQVKYLNNIVEQDHRAIKNY
jgi:transposase-like protein